MKLGLAQLSRAADLVSTGLSELKGATAPRLQLELLCARLLLPAAGWFVPIAASSAASRIASARMWPAQEYTRVIFEAPVPVPHTHPWFRGVAKSIARLKSVAPNLVIIGDNPVSQKDPPDCLAKRLRDASKCNVSRDRAIREDRISAEVAAARANKAIFIDTYTMFAGDNGGFAEYLENAAGDTVKVRTGDGVHFDTAGGDMIAREVLKQLNTLFDQIGRAHV